MRSLFRLFVCLSVRDTLELWVNRICWHLMLGQGCGSVVRKTAGKYSQPFSPGDCLTHAGCCSVVVSRFTRTSSHRSSFARFCSSSTSNLSSPKDNTPTVTSYVLSFHQQHNYHTKKNKCIGIDTINPPGAATKRWLHAFHRRHRVATPFCTVRHNYRIPSFKRHKLVNIRFIYLKISGTIAEGIPSLKIWK